ncbi:Predicted oxidoreductase [Paenibacillus sp. 1_12]|uniref:aldo/keto reductase n=1 Tax=Paenibacillus sp. 1_12 TaxID=1566278 RepID=UPI0008EB96AA|nr:aldo/keto reductase [Paenibacillus sp. 1_12]SFM08443.1 Predicted oxidoreductase [Paenibacillus sp. 1_12]
MKPQPLAHWGLNTSRLVFGCMGLGGDWTNGPITNEHVHQAEQVTEAALEAGISMFDHADIYRSGKAELVFGQMLKARPSLRDNMIIQSKCGIRFADGDVPGRYDFSKQYIQNSVDGILKRLGIETLDILLLHRPDPLMDPDEVAEVIEFLYTSGKVKRFGVSNMSEGQIRFLQQASSQPFIINQLEISLGHLHFLDQGVHINQEAGTSVNFTDGLLEHCHTEHIQVQAWSPLAKGIFSGQPVDGASEAVRQTAALVAKLAQQKETSQEAIVLGWLMRHPSRIQPVIGTTNLQRILACRDAERQAELMTREEWYQLYVSARGVKLP